MPPKSRHRRSNASTVKPNYFRKLSVELLVAIFEELARSVVRDLWVFSREYSWFRGDEDWEDSGQIPTSTFFWTPLELQLVCKQWADICTTNTAIWSHLVLPFIGDMHLRVYTPSYLTQRLQKFLAASRPSQLHITFIAIDGDIFSASNNTSFQTCQSYVWAECARWRSMDILMAYPDSPTTWPQLSSIPPITHICLSEGMSASWTNLLQLGPSSIQHWLSLESVSLDILASYRDNIPLSMLPHLRHVIIVLDNCYLTGARVSNDTLLYILSIVSGSSRLRNLRVVIPSTSWRRYKKVWRPEPEDNGPRDFHCRLPGLEILEFKGYVEGGPKWAPFLACLFLPRLRYLTITEPIPLCLASCLERWGSNLHSLSITMRPDVEFYYLPQDLLAALPDLHSLEVYAYTGRRSSVILDQIADGDSMPLLRYAAFGLLHNDAFISDGEKALVGFDYATSLLWLLEARPLIRRVEGIFSCSVPFTSTFNGELERFCHAYDITVYGESMMASKLRKGLPILEGHVDSDGRFTPGEH